ncbi:hypothetical protein ACFFX0_23015 [Citricoccus parietis]|uniref:Uncharacterized protein n=1 Tax=Citricoccus parietis TaxID=592307 RepID=A0ABV5G5J3_9MICC
MGGPAGRDGGRGGRLSACTRGFWSRPLRTGSTSPCPWWPSCWPSGPSATA